MVVTVVTMAVLAVAMVETTLAAIILHSYN